MRATMSAMVSRMVSGDRSAVGLAVAPKGKTGDHAVAESSFSTWTAPAAALPVTWDEALRRLENPDTVRRHR